MRNQLFIGVATAALVIPAAAGAQQITTGIQGTVTSDEGAPIAGANVTITDTRTGHATNATTSGDGSFTSTGLVTGGPYTVAVDADGFEGQSVQNIITTLQGNTSVTFKLASGQGDIVVTAQRASVTQLAVGPGQSFGQEAMAAASSFNRDIRDVLRIDPRVSLNRDSEIDHVSCLGGNDRFNTFTVDGTVQADIYGLNSTPFASRSTTPIPYDAIRETQVQFAPFDVEYGQFTGCAINVVTKSGSNQFHAGGFFEYTGPGLRADSLFDSHLNKKVPVAKNPVSKDWGASISGPIIKDHLFFYGAYEATKSGTSQDFGPAGSGFTNELPNVTETQFNDISQVIHDQYGIDTGPLVRNLPSTTRRFFGRADWYITQGQRLEVTYQRLDESKLSNGDFNTGSQVITGANNYYLSGTKSDYFSGRLYSNWTDKFSTEIRYSKSLVTDVQDPFGGGEAQSGSPITRIVVGVGSGAAGSGEVVAGPDFSRTANDLRTKIDQFKLKANYHGGNHELTFGVEANHANIFNLFVQNATGTLVFQDLAHLKAGLIENGTSTSNNTPSVVTGGTAIGAIIATTPTGDINTAAAAFSRTIWSGYAQDDWHLSPSFDVVAGIRTDWYSGGSPIFNQNFFNKYGISNAVDFGKIDPVILPRLAFTWKAGDHGMFGNVQVKGGIGEFSGGDPAVWFGNAFQNNGFGFASGTSNPAASTCPANIKVTDGSGHFTGFPQCAVAAGEAISGAGISLVSNVDPNFKSPTVFRANLGVNTNLGHGSGFFGNWHVALDYIFSLYQNPANIVDLSETQDIRKGLNGYSITGQPIYAQINPLLAGCNATLVSHGTPPVWTGVTAPCFTSLTNGEFELTNAGNYRAHVISAVLSKTFHHGIFTPGGSVYMNFGYAYTNSHDRRDMYSSVAGSNYNTTAEFDYQDPESTTSFFETKHNFTFAGDFKEQIFGDYNTELGFVFTARSGRPYSLTWTGTGVFNPSSAVSSNGALLYIPTGMSDPNISPTSNATAVNQLVAYAQNLACAKDSLGKNAVRNGCRNPWYFDLDLTFSQEIPGPGRLFGHDDKIRLYAGLDNVLNLIDSKWNMFRTRDFAGRQAVATTTGVDAQGRYIITGFNAASDVANITTSASAWRVKFGASYNF